MKNFFIILFGVLTFSACANLEGNYLSLDHGTIIAIDSTNAKIALRHEGKSDSICWHIARLRDDMGLWRMEYQVPLTLGKQVWIYQKDDVIVASHVNIMQARNIKNSLSAYNLSQFYNWFNVLLYIGCAITIVIMLLWTRNGVISGAKLIVLFIFVIFCITHSAYVTNIGKDLGYEGEGIINSIKGNIVQTTDNQNFYLNNFKDLCQQSTLETGTQAYFYRYGHKYINKERIDGEILFASTEKINQPTLNAFQTYPNTWWKIYGFILILWIIMVISWGCFIDKFPSWLERLREKIDCDDD